MSTESEGNLGQLFSASQGPADEEFVRKVARRVVRRRQLRALALVGGALVLVVAGLSPLFSDAVLYVAQIPARFALSAELSFFSSEGGLLPVLIGIGVAFRATMWTSD